jgi:hypothetical protein
VIEPNAALDLHRRTHPHLGASPRGAAFGYFERGPLRIISSGNPDDRPEAAGWEHVSVSCADRCPTWDEMQAVKVLFWGPDATVLQFHPKESHYVRRHPFVLHLWRRAGVDAELPPASLIG